METKNTLTSNNILERAKLVLKIESEEIKAQIDKLDQNFVNACAFKNGSLINNIRNPMEGILDLVKLFLKV